MSPRSLWECHKPTKYATGLYFAFQIPNEQEILSKTTSVTSILVLKWHKSKIANNFQLAVKDVLSLGESDIKTYALFLHYVSTPQLLRYIAHKSEGQIGPMKEQ